MLKRRYLCCLIVRLLAALLLPQPRLLSFVLLSVFYRLNPINR